MKKSRSRALLIAGIFAIVSGVWIILTDQMVLLLFHEADQLTEYQTYKGWFYVLMATLLVYFLSIRYYKKRTDLADHLEYLANIFDTVNEAIFIEDADTGKILDVNNKACEMYGYSKNEILTKSIGDLSATYSPFTQEDAVEFLKEVKKGKRIVKEWKARNKQGDEFWVEVNATHGKIGDQSRYFITIRDISDRKRAESDLSNIFLLSNDLMCIADLDQRKFTRINPAFTRLLGYTENEILSHPFIEFIHEDDREKTIHQIIRKLKQGNEVINFENRYKCKDGSYKWFSWVSHPVYSEGYVFAIAHDITERKKTEEELNKYRENLEKLVEERTGELAQKNSELKEINKELEHFNELFVGREFRINELKNEIIRLKKQGK